MNCNAGYCEFSSAPPGTARALGVIFRSPAVRGWQVCRMHGARGGAPKGRQNEQLPARRRNKRDNRALALDQIVGLNVRYRAYLGQPGESIQAFEERLDSALPTW
jgi:hypothetical protein